MNYPNYKGRPAVIVGTGPSLDIDEVKKAADRGCVVFGVNNTYLDIDIDVWIACDPSWHEIYSPVTGGFIKFHWDKIICERFNYFYVEGRWGNGPNRCSGLSVDPNYIEYGHSSSFQALGLAVHCHCDPIYLVGHDFNYDDKQRHYFSGLSEQPGEYPAKLRKSSTFDGLKVCYEQIKKQTGLPEIINATPGSKLDCFPFADLHEDLNKRAKKQWSKVATPQP